MDRVELDTVILDAVLEEVAREFQCAAPPVDQGYGEVDGWDSLGHLMLLLSIEERFMVKLSTREIPELTTPVKIVTALQAHGVTS